MLRDGKTWLFIAAILSAAGSAIHFGCIIGGPEWYRFFGAGRRVIHMVERGFLMPHIYTAGIGIIVAGWALYALSGAGAIRRLPLLKTGLVLISAVCLVRAAALPILLHNMGDPDRSAAFIIWSSAAMLIFGIVFAVGTALRWQKL